MLNIIKYYTNLKTRNKVMIEPALINHDRHRFVPKGTRKNVRKQKLIVNTTLKLLTQHKYIYLNLPSRLSVTNNQSKPTGTLKKQQQQ